MPGVKIVGLEFLGNGDCSRDVAFPSLEILSFAEMQGWEVWSTSGGFTDAVFPCLRELHIVDCPKLVEASLEALPSLSILCISGCGDGVLRSMIRAASSVTKLKLWNIAGLTQLWKGVIEHLGAVEEASIWECHEVRYLWKSEVEICKILVNLRKLTVYGCNNLVQLEEKEQDDCGSSLESLREVIISHCDRLDHYKCLNNIETLQISCCPSVTSVSFPTEGHIETLRIYNCPSITSVWFLSGGQKLKTLWIRICEKLLEKESGGEEKSRVLINSSMSLLESLHIDNWPNLKSLPSFSCFIHLTSLWITDCKHLESFPDHELPNLMSLTSLQICNCPSMDDSFPRGLWPPNLSDLLIGGLKKPISEWGPQNFPVSLVYLSLLGGSLEDVGCNSSQLYHLLPPSLLALDISEFEKLVSLTNGLQHLSSLQHLYIWKCPKIKDLPETPLPSLLSLSIGDCPEINDLPETLLPLLLKLHISNCPKLKERCSRRGSYWSHISHIPCILMH